MNCFTFLKVGQSPGGEVTSLHPSRERSLKQGCLQFQLQIAHQLVNNLYNDQRLDSIDVKHFQKVLFSAAFTDVHFPQELTDYWHILAFSFRNYAKRIYQLQEAGLYYLSDAIYLSSFILIHTAYARQPHRSRRQICIRIYVHTHT